MTKRFSCLVILLNFIFSGFVFGQNDINNSISIIQLLDSFSQNAGIQFAYNPGQFEKIYLPKSSGEKMDLDSFLSILEKNGIEYVSIDKERWLLKLKKEAKEEPQTILLSGTVLEQDNNPLVSALIFTEGAEFSSLTDIEGQFTLQISNRPDFKICCQYLGYEVSCISSKNIQNGNINFTLTPKAIYLDDVLIKTKRVRISVNAIEDSEKMMVKGSELNEAMMGKDVIRSVQMLSGVDATNDLNAALSIRASSEFQSLITLDGIPIYNPQSAFGIFSAINPLSVEEFQLFKNALPLEYGEFTGAYLACKGLTTPIDKLKLNLDINTLSTSAGIQIPLSERSQLSATVRKSNGRISNRQFYSRLRPERMRNPQLTNIFNRPTLLDTELENTFFDSYLNFVTRNKNKNASLSFSLYLNRDESGSNYDDENTFMRGKSENFITINENFTQLRVNRNIGASINYQYLFNNNNKLFLQFYSSRYRLLDEIDASVNFRNRQGSRTNTYTSQAYNEVIDSDLKIQYETDPSKLFSWKSGIDFRRIQSDVRFRTNNRNPISQILTIPSITPYAGISFNVKERLVMDIGTRVSNTGRRGDVILNSPRTSLSYKLAEGWFLKTSASHNEQIFRPIEIEQQLAQNITMNVLANGNEIPILSTNQFTLGTSIEKGIVKLNSDLYWRRSNGILEQVLTQPGINTGDTQIFTNNAYELINGQSQVLGVDVTSYIEYKEFSSLFSYTYSNARERYKELFNNQFLPSQTNRLHQVNAFSSYDWNNWTFSTTFIYGSGVYTLNRETLEANVARRDIDPNQLFKQLPDYKRWDISTSYNIPLKHGALSLDFSMYNVLNNNNINSEIYIYALQQDNVKALGAAEINLLNRVWTVGIRYKL